MEQVPAPNPYAAPSTLETLQTPQVSDFESIAFDGIVHERDLQNTFWTPKSILGFGSGFVFLLFVAVTVLFTMSNSIEHMLLRGCAWAILIMYSCYLVYAYSFPEMATKSFVRRLRSQRPWLTGAVQGVVNAWSITVWHGKVGIQVLHRDNVVEIGKDGITVFSGDRPFAIVPTTAFYESQWRTVLELVPMKLPSKPEPVQPAADAFVCSIPRERLSFLDHRLEGTRWKLIGGWISWFVASAIVYSIVSIFELQVGIELLVADILCTVLAFYLVRTLMWKWHLHRQFGRSGRGYFGARKTDEDQSLSWFTQEQIFWCGRDRWISVPTQYVQRVRVSFACLEFQIPSANLRFHREGFMNQEQWLSACESIRELAKNGGFRQVSRDTTIADPQH